MELRAIHVEPHIHGCCDQICYQYADHGEHNCEVSMICNTCNADVALLGHDDNCADVLEAQAVDRSEREFRGAQTQRFRSPTRSSRPIVKVRKLRGSKIRANRITKAGTIDRRRNWTEVS